MSGCEKDWVDIVSAFGTPAIAVVGAWIALQQWRLSKSRFRHELFEKRYSIFEATMAYLGSLISHGEVVQEDRIAFLKGTKGAFALFDRKIVAYLDDLHKKSLLLRLHAKKREHEAETEVLTWLTEQLEKVDKVFERHLKIE